MRTSFRQTIFATTAIIALLIFALGAFSAGAAAAGAGDPTAVHPSSGGGQAATPAKPDRTRNAEAGVEDKIADLRAKLEITAAQQGPWEQFAQVMRDNAQSIDQAFQQRMKSMPGMTAIENLQSYADLVAEHAKEVQKLVPAFQPVYDTFSDNQKRRADDVFRTNAHHEVHHDGAARHG